MCNSFSFMPSVNSNASFLDGNFSCYDVEKYCFILIQWSPTGRQKPTLRLISLAIIFYTVRDKRAQTSDWQENDVDIVMKCSNRFHVSKTRLLENKVQGQGICWIISQQCLPLDLPVCKSAVCVCHTSLSTSALCWSMFTRGKGGYSLIWTRRVCAAEQGMVFRGTDFLKRVQFLLLSVLNRVHTIGTEALKSSLQTGDQRSTCAVCDQEPLSKIYWLCLQLSKHYGYKEDAICEVEAYITTRPLDKSRLIM